MPRGRPVVQTVSAARTGTVVVAVVAVLAFAFTIALAHDRLRVIITSVLVAAFFSAGMILMIPIIAKRSVPPIRRIDPDQLPPAVGIWKVNITAIVLMLVIGVAYVVLSLSMHNYTLIGILLGGPIITWNEVRKAKRTEYELHGTLWHTTGFSWRSKSRSRYLVAKA